jgi:ubiquinone/menaquinone biosynthesis C-methylase UbiE
MSVWIGYTTHYREGGDQLMQAATTLAASMSRAGRAVQCVAVNSKREFVDAMALAGPLDELHLFSHSGMYGPMFGTTSLPEQFSPHEWRQLELPLVDTAQAYVHACRTGRWFAPFFARTTGVAAYGHHGYTTFSRSPDRYRFAPRFHRGPIYVVGQPGFKESGVVGLVGKHGGLRPPRPMMRFEPMEAHGATYEAVADAYDAVFRDIRVRGPEWAWLSSRVPHGSDVLDLGCGTGALLRALQPRLRSGVGVDASDAMIGHALRHGGDGLRFETIDGPVLPIADRSVDVVTSLLSWRYLDWDPVLAEIVRVLRPGGRLLVVDMVARPARIQDWPVVLAHKLRAERSARRFPGFREAQAALVGDPAWAQMLRYNPIRAPHELTRFFASRFPGCTHAMLDVGLRTAVYAFDTGPVSARWVAPQSYP